MPTEKHPVEVINRQAMTVQQDYVIQKNDLLKLAVYSNKGERFIDPNPDISNTNTGGAKTAKTGEEINYLVDQAGIVKLPLIGELKLEGLTLRQAEEVAQKEYSKFFTDAYVQLGFANKRVIVLGAPGGLIVPLANQNVTVAEVLASAKGIGNDAKANKIKLIRNDHVYAIDFSTIEGFQQGNVVVQAGDIVYVEPVRRPFAEGLRDNYFIGSMLLSLATIFLIYRTR
ncbi:MAG: polysaccharide biosynthesis/export family protein [Bacteroidetes bacterium]|nr:polysaccharide biosynthesis/export family protein [Bacteroidota bacterium]MBS1541836.1 polysaccharide biosynthesis/export family protein [Bacteroidota bacterium]